MCNEGIYKHLETKLSHGVLLYLILLSSVLVGSVLPPTHNVLK